MKSTMIAAICWLEAHCVTADGRPVMFEGETLRSVADRLSVGADPRSGGSTLGEVLARRHPNIGPVPAPLSFAGYAAGGEAYACADNGCECGWTYVYFAGEPMIST